MKIDSFEEKNKKLTYSHDVEVDHGFSKSSKNL